MNHLNTEFQPFILGNLEVSEDKNGAHFHVKNCSNVLCVQSWSDATPILNLKDERKTFTMPIGMFVKAVEEYNKGRNNKYKPSVQVCTNHGIAYVTCDEFKIVPDEDMNQMLEMRVRVNFDNFKLGKSVTLETIFPEGHNGEPLAARLKLDEFRYLHLNVAKYLDHNGVAFSIKEQEESKTDLSATDHWIMEHLHSHGMPTAKHNIVIEDMANLSYDKDSKMLNIDIEDPNVAGVFQCWNEFDNIDSDKQINRVADCADLIDIKRVRDSMDNLLKEKMDHSWSFLEHLRGLVWRPSVSIDVELVEGGGEDQQSRSLERSNIKTKDEVIMMTSNFAKISAVDFYPPAPVGTPSWEKSPGLEEIYDSIPTLNDDMLIANQRNVSWLNLGEIRDILNSGFVGDKMTLSLLQVAHIFTTIFIVDRLTSLTGYSKEQLLYALAGTYRTVEEGVMNLNGDIYEPNGLPLPLAHTGFSLTDILTAINSIDTSERADMITQWNRKDVESLFSDISTASGGFPHKEAIDYDSIVKLYQYNTVLKESGEDILHPNDYMLHEKIHNVVIETADEDLNRMYQGVPSKLFAYGYDSTVVGPINTNITMQLNELRESLPDSEYIQRETELAASATESRSKIDYTRNIPILLEDFKKTLKALFLDLHSAQYVKKPDIHSLDAFTPLRVVSEVNVREDFDTGNKYVFNKNTTYVPNQKYILNVGGTYILKNVPVEHPIAILNKGGKEGLISYVGDDDKKLTKEIPEHDDELYDFYHGDVTVTVSGDFKNVSVYCFNHKYMGGENIFISDEQRQADINAEAGGFVMSSSLMHVNAPKLFPLINGSVLDTEANKYTFYNQKDVTHDALTELFTDRVRMINGGYIDNFVDYRGEGEGAPAAPPDWPFSSYYAVPQMATSVVHEVVIEEQVQEGASVSIREPIRRLVPMTGTLEGIGKVAKKTSFTPEELGTIFGLAGGQATALRQEEVQNAADVLGYSEIFGLRSSSAEARSRNVNDRELETHQLPDLETHAHDLNLTRIRVNVGGDEDYMVKSLASQTGASESYLSKSLMVAEPTRTHGGGTLQPDTDPSLYLGLAGSGYTNTGNFTANQIATIFGRRSHSSSANRNVHEDSDSGEGLEVKIRITFSNIPIVNSKETYVRSNGGTLVELASGQSRLDNVQTRPLAEGEELPSDYKAYPHSMHVEIYKNGDLAGKPVYPWYHDVLAKAKNRDGDSSVAKSYMDDIEEAIANAASTALAGGNKLEVNQTVDLGDCVEEVEGDCTFISATDVEHFISILQGVEQGVFKEFIDNITKQNKTIVHVAPPAAAPVEDPPLTEAEKEAQAKHDKAIQGLTQFGWGFAGFAVMMGGWHVVTKLLGIAGKNIYIGGSSLATYWGTFSKFVGQFTTKIFQFVSGVGNTLIGTPLRALKSVVMGGKNLLTTGSIQGAAGEADAIANSVNAQIKATTTMNEAFEAEGYAGNITADIEGAQQEAFSEAMIDSVAEAQAEGEISELTAEIAEGGGDALEAAAEDVAVDIAEKAAAGDIEGAAETANAATEAFAETGNQLTTLAAAVEEDPAFAEAAAQNTAEAFAEAVGAEGPAEAAEPFAQLAADAFNGLKAEAAANQAAAEARAAEAAEEAGSGAAEAGEAGTEAAAEAAQASAEAASAATEALAEGAGVAAEIVEAGAVGAEIGGEVGAEAAIESLAAVAEATAVATDAVAAAAVSEGLAAAADAALLLLGA